MEETIGYEALFSAEEWAELDLADWKGDGPDGPDPDAHHTTTLYEVAEGVEVECELCGSVGTATSETEAQAIARLHEAFVATLVEKWRVTA